jgi:hypothetical protein
MVRESAVFFSFLFSALYFLVFFFFLIAINLLMFVPMRKDCC